MIVNTIFGDEIVHDSLLQELIESKPFQRLKYIHQSGVAAYICDDLKNWTRYEHSLGVWWLLHHYNCSYEEQIAGLLHDVSHTVFSHVGEFVFAHECHKDSYQDTIHAWYLRESGIESVLNKYNMTLDQVLHKAGTFLALEQDLPAMCADRLEYNISIALKQERLHLDQLNNFLQALHYKDGAWFFNSLEPARLLGESSLYHTEHIWGAPWNFLAYDWAAQALRRAIEIGLITKHDIHFGYDDEIWEKLKTCDSFEIKKIIHTILNVYSLYKAPEENGNNYYTIKPKFRGIDPLVMCERKLQLLSSCDPIFKQKFNRVKSLCAQGFVVQLLVT